MILVLFSDPVFPAPPFSLSKFILICGLEKVVIYSSEIRNWKKKVLLEIEGHFIMIKVSAPYEESTVINIYGFNNIYIFNNLRNQSN